MRELILNRNSIIPDKEGERWDGIALPIRFSYMKASFKIINEGKVVTLL